MRTIRLVNVIPNDHSNEFNGDAEPSIAVNPNNIDEMVVTAFTPTEGGNTNGPFFFSSDGGENWSLMFEIPGGETLDQSPAFARTSNELCMGIIRGDNQRVNVIRTGNPAGGAAVDVIENRAFVDQPWVDATTVIGGPDDGKDRLYVGYNDSGARSATLEIWLDASASSPTFTQFDSIRGARRQTTATRSGRLPIETEPSTSPTRAAARSSGTTASPTSSSPATTTGAKVPPRSPP